MPITTARNGTRMRFDWVLRPRSVGMPIASPPNGKPCWHCRYFEGLTIEGCALCLHPGCSKSKATPWCGCCSWEREPGTDDEPGPPTDCMRIHWPASAKPG